MRIVTLFELGQSSRKITCAIKASNCHVNQSTVLRIWQRFRKNGGSVSPKKPSGRPRLPISAQDIRRVVRHVRTGREERRSTCSELCTMIGLMPKQRWTLSRRLKAHGVQQWRPIKKQFLRPQHRVARLKFCRFVAHWTAADWKNVVWSDESHFARAPKDQRRVWRLRGEGINVDCLALAEKFGGGPGIMVWGAIGGPLGTNVLVQCPSGTITGVSYQDTLGNELLPDLQLHTPTGRQVILMHDGATAHTSSVVKKFLSHAMLNVLPNWPANSPDLNPIEGIWGEIKAKLQGRKFSSAEALWHEVRELWQVISQQRIHGFGVSMVKRIQACIKAKGGHF